MRNLRQLTTAFACALAALLAVPTLAATAAAAPPAGEEYDLDLPSDPNQGQDGGAEASDADPAPGPATDPAPAPGDSAPTGGASADEDPGGDGTRDGDGTRSNEGSPQPPGFEPQLASGGTPGNPAAAEGFPTLPVALAAAAVLAVPFGIWLLRRRRA